MMRPPNESIQAKKLEAAGWKVGSAAEFLELNDAEEMLVNMKLALARQVRAMRLEKKTVARGSGEARRFEPIADCETRNCRPLGLDRIAGPSACVTRCVTIANRKNYGDAGSPAEEDGRLSVTTWILKIEVSYVQPRITRISRIRIDAQSEFRSTSSRSICPEIVFCDF